MDKLIIQGGTPLIGEVNISGMKNAAVAILPATILINGECTIENLPNISDVKLCYEILESLGATITYIDEHTVKVDTSNVTSTSIPVDIARKFRASYYFIGALLGRFGESNSSLPGGCDLGPRAVDQHIKGFEALGAIVDCNDDDLTIAVKADKLLGSTIYLDVVSVGATINIMLAAVLAQGITTIENAAKEPHIVDVANFLNTMGADITGAGTDVIKINGTSNLSGNKTYSVIPDQIEAGTFMMAAMATKGDILVKNCITTHLSPIISKLEEMGAEVTDNFDEVRVKYVGKLNPVHIKTLPYPGFPTDMQPQTAVALCSANGTSVITENIWSSRFQYTNELKKMNANFSVKDQSTTIKQVDNLKGAPVYATDLRAGAALIIAGIAATGTTEIFNIDHIDRGYENIEEKFRGLGAKIKREKYD